MTLESALLAALSAVTTALCWVVKLMYARLLKAEETVEELRQEMERLERENGQNSAKVSMFERCPKRQDCPFNALGYPAP
jgi:cell division protein FtsB